MAQMLQCVRFTPAGQATMGRMSVRLSRLTSSASTLKGLRYCLAGGVLGLVVGERTSRTT